jgi:4-amino-4-deoxy-L-arabinose transferase-like glycosyltransferase
MIPSDMEASNSAPPASAPASAAQAGEAAVDSPGKSLPVLLVLAAGFLARLAQAWAYFLDPDEAFHNLLASYSSFSLTYQATLTTAHPPLLIFLLHCWRWLGQSEFMLRLPSVLAGTAGCGLAYLWLRRVTGRSTAFLGLLLFAFSPALVGLSAEVRQYALLTFFTAACLYFAERALQDDSLLFMNLFSLALYGALLAHYSALLFAFSMGVYMLLRLYPWRERTGLFAAWAGGQLVAGALVAYFLLVHVSRLRQVGMPQGIAETWLRKSFYHAGESSLLLFPARQTLRVFTYLFSHGLLGTLAMFAFLAGVAALLKRRSPQTKRPSSGELATLLVLPFVVNCAVAIAGLYPYGGTRHNVYLSFFAILGTSLGLALWKPKQDRWRTLLVILCLAVCNLFPAPPPLIRPRNHRRDLMDQAVVFLRRSAPPGSILFTDYQSGLLLGYYACGHGVVQVFFPLEPFAQAHCGPYTIITALPQSQRWELRAGEFADQLASAAQKYRIAPGTGVWLFEAGWRTDAASAVTMALSRLGCTEPRHFGGNILVCRLTIENRDPRPPGALQEPLGSRGGASGRNGRALSRGSAGWAGSPS